MNKNRRQFGFSLLEALLATGILGVGLVLIAMVFPVGVKLTSVAAERSIGSIAANEAFAKIQLWGSPDVWPTLPNQTCVDYVTLVNEKYEGPGWTSIDLAWEEFLYPSAVVQGQSQSYHWSALGRRVDDRQIQMTVFISRRISPTMQYYRWKFVNDILLIGQSPWPSPVPVRLEYEEGNPKQLKVLEARNSSEWGANIFSFFGNNTILVDDTNGKLYRVVEYKASATGGRRDTLVLEYPWQWEGMDQDPTDPPDGPLTLRFWVVPPGIGSARNPVVGVFQQTITFE